MRLLLIRHAESSANAEGRIQGHLDIPLSDRGRRQSEALAERISHLNIDALYTSPLKRASETAAAIAAKTKLTPELEPDLVERNVGELAGLTREDIIDRFPDYMRARVEGRQVEISGFERDDVFNQRVDRTISAIIDAHHGQTVAAISHGGVIAAMCRRTLQIPTVRPGPFAIDNCSINIFDVRDEEGPGRARPRILLVALNDTCHLDGLLVDA